MLMKGGPKSEQIEHVVVGGYGMEPLAPYWDFKDALGELRRGDKRWAFEEVPLVEVDSKSQYDELLEAMGVDVADGDWQKSGLYDVRDDPPEFRATLDDYELEEMERAADDAIDFMFQGDNWEEAYGKLVSE